MRALNFQDKYPIFTADIEKSGCIYADLPALTAYFKNCIRQEPKVQYLGEFDHLAHTRAIGGDVNPAIAGAINLVFCFGFALPDPKVLAVRPRSGRCATNRRPPFALIAINKIAISALHARARACF